MRMLYTRMPKKKSDKRKEIQMKKKITAALLVAAMLPSLAACSGGSAGTTVSDSAETTAPDSTENPSARPAWDQIDRNLIIASVESAENPDEFNITFGDFYSEYLYYLLSYGIEDDMSDDYREACKSFREEIINYLQFEHIFLKVAEEKGVGVSSLTESELSEIQTNADNAHENFRSKYYSVAVEELGEDASEDAIKKRQEELLTADLSRAELTPEIFTTWERNNLIQNKLITRLTENIEITEEEIDKMFDEYVQMAKDALASDPLSYESNATYTWIYVPEGTRLADQILFLFDEETRQAISEARNAGNDGEADRLREHAYEQQLKGRTQALLERIKNGEDFNALQAELNEDGADDPYAVIVGSKRYVSEFTEATFSIAEIGGVSEPAVSDYGVHVIQYAGDATVTNEDLTEIRQSMKEYLIAQEQTAIQQAAYEEWLARFPYVVDYDILQLNETAQTEEPTDASNS